ncbi:uncharacterized protein BDCG_06093 [Blastomyces dermatitidis ER-3]|uniref:Uncharacterized protein n=1 Tax=Ajellomyces dermatitidis (strain ER-3 / ATCC MYA-2586) TaxID=559297 RepID=A0ABP2F2F2_AJEDR|nr:uncharacterized protein BDCG_06093 [Blastomyces dermatitidis ER-3]EEQ90973.2 hypothetical protein BDCG_06093 [Blastomyces dermatitidis ER-3]EQL36053.1 hypothetical protein BDFG_02316 [Blastomyces dermatitidis ATCC 26199]
MTCRMHGTIKERYSNNEALGLDSGRLNPSHEAHLEPSKEDGSPPGNVRSSVDMPGDLKNAYSFIYEMYSPNRAIFNVHNGHAGSLVSAANPSQPLPATLSWKMQFDGNLGVLMHGIDNQAFSKPSKWDILFFLVFHST